MQLSIRDASRFVIGAAILREMANKNAPEAVATFDNVASMALRPGADGTSLSASIEKLADQEAAWFRSTPPHTLATDRVMHTRTQEVGTLNASNLAVFATIACGPDALAGQPQATVSLQGRLQAAMQAIDQMPGSTTERRQVLQSLTSDTIAAVGDPAFMTQQLNTAQKVYLERFREERLAAYAKPSPGPTDEPELGH